MGSRKSLEDRLREDCQWAYRESNRLTAENFLLRKKLKILTEEVERDRQAAAANTGDKSPDDNHGSHRRDNPDPARKGSG